MKGVVLKNFPFALDGINVFQLAAGAEFPPEGYSVVDKTFQGLVDAGFVKEDETRKVPAEQELNRRLIDALDKKLGASSDEELKAIIARRGTPFSGNMVHAVLVTDAKTQLLAEFEGAEPKLGIDPNAGVTEQPLSAPGQATPPSAAAAIKQQQANQQALEANQNQEGGVGTGGGENKATNQFGDPLPGSQPKSGEKTEAELNTMNKADLEAYAVEKKIDLGEAKTKAEYVEALKPKN